MTAKACGLGAVGGIIVISILPACKLKDLVERSAELLLRPKTFARGLGIAAEMMRQIVEAAPNGPPGKGADLKQKQLPSSRRGRPRKDTTDKQQLIIGALVKHHRYEAIAIVGNFTPATLGEIVKLTRKKAADKSSGVHATTVTRFFQAQFPEDGRNGYGYKGYVAACRNKGIRIRLAAWNGEPLERLAELRKDEGSPDDKPSGRWAPGQRSDYENPDPVEV